MKGLFISGGGTDVGKTYVALRLIKILNKKHQVKARKPIESDCKKTSSGLIPRDATLLSEACNTKEPIEKVCSFCFEACVSPEKASKDKDVTITLNMLVSACQTNNTKDYIVVEGAGGIYSPIASKTLNIDLAKALSLPVVLIIKDELGAINQALLSLQAAQQQELKVAMIVLNQIHANSLDNKKAISSYTKTPVVMFRDNDPKGFERDVESLV